MILNWVDISMSTHNYNARHYGMWLCVCVCARFVAHSRVAFHLFTLQSETCAVALCFISAKFEIAVNNVWQGKSAATHAECKLNADECQSARLLGLASHAIGAADHTFCAYAHWTIDTASGKQIFKTKHKTHNIYTITSSTCYGQFAKYGFKRICSSFVRLLWSEITMRLLPPCRFYGLTWPQYTASRIRAPCTFCMQFSQLWMESRETGREPDG